MAVKPIPEGYRTLTAYLAVDDAAAAIDFYTKAFGATERSRMDAPGGKIGHAELEIGDSVFMLSDPFPQSTVKSPKDAGTTTASMFMYSEDVDAAIERARKKLPVLTKLEVECDRLEQVEEAAKAGADVIMLDNMSVADMTRAVELIAGRAKVEASGGINIDTIGPISRTGVDYISTSKITQSAPAVDIGLDEA